jgi:hypothetical protein
MIGIKDAVKAATVFLMELLDPKELNDVLLEEVELSPDSTYWYITLGYTRPITVSTSSRGIHPLQELTRPTAERVYKRITVRADTGQPVAMKIRAVEKPALA